MNGVQSNSQFESQFWPELQLCMILLKREGLVKADSRLAGRMAILRTLVSKTDVWKEETRMWKNEEDDEC